MTAQNEAAGEGYFQISDKKPICAVEASGGEAEASAAESSRRITAESRHYDENSGCFNSGTLSFMDDLEVKRQPHCLLLHFGRQLMLWGPEIKSISGLKCDSVRQDSIFPPGKCGSFRSLFLSSDFSG